jgi:hypothetical protein
VAKLRELQIPGKLNFKVCFLLFIVSQRYTKGFHEVPQRKLKYIMLEISLMEKIICKKENYKSIIEEG